MKNALKARAILFDLFGTLVRFDTSRVPVLQLPRGPVPSTVPSYASMLAEIQPGLDPAAFHEALVAVSEEIVRARRQSHREMPSRERFARALQRLGVGGENVQVHAERLSLAHMEQLVAAATAHPGHCSLLERLGKRAVLGCITNFDHAPSALRILHRTGIAPFLTAVVVSDSFGLCKPSPAIFHEGLRALEVRAYEAIFVGDSFTEDVCGATSAGLAAVWLNPTGSIPPSGPVPTATIRDLTEIEALVTG